MSINTLNQPVIDTRSKSWLTSQLIFSQHSIDTWSTVGQKSAGCRLTHMHQSKVSWLLTTVNWDVDWALIKGQLRVDQVSIKGIDQHMTTAAFMYHSIPKPPISPRANPGAFDFFEKFWSNSPLCCQFGRSNAPPIRASKRVKSPTLQACYSWNNRI